MCLTYGNCKLWIHKNNATAIVVLVAKRAPRQITPDFLLGLDGDAANDFVAGRYETPSEMQIVDEIEEGVHYLAEKCNRNFYRLAITEKMWYALLG